MEARRGDGVGAGWGARLRGALFSREGVLLLILVASALVLNYFNPNLLTTRNLLSQSRLFAELGLVALPMTFIIITGGIDLSVGSILGLSAILLGVSWQGWGFPLPLAIAFSLLVGVLAGLFNGYLIVRMRVPPLIMTLATLALYRGLAQGISEARSVTGYPAWFVRAVQGTILGLPVPLWLFLIAAVACAVALHRTTFGRTLYAMGNNMVAARFSGLRVDRVTLMIYALSGLMSAVAAVLFVARVTTTRSDMGTGLELNVITAVVLGGTSIFGGQGTIAGTVIGLLLIQLLKNGLALSGMTSDATIVVIGAMLILAILANNLVQRVRARGLERG